MVFHAQYSTKMKFYSLNFCIMIISGVFFPINKIRRWIFCDNIKTSDKIIFFSWEIKFWFRNVAIKSCYWLLHHDGGEATTGDNHNTLSLLFLSLSFSCTCILLSNLRNVTATTSIATATISCLLIECAVLISINLNWNIVTLSKFPNICVYERKTK